MAKKKITKKELRELVLDFKTWAKGYETAYEAENRKKPSMSSYELCSFAGAVVMRVKKIHANLRKLKVRRSPQKSKSQNL